jgi:hypothetical protein
MKKKKMVNVPIDLEQNSNFLTSTVDLDVDDVNDSSSTTSNFVTFSSFVTTIPLNVVPTITQSFVYILFGVVWSLNFGLVFIYKINIYLNINNMFYLII